MSPKREGVVAWLCENDQPELAMTVTSERARDAYAVLGRKITPLVPAQSLADMQDEVEERDATIREQNSQLSAMEMCAADMQARLRKVAELADDMQEEISGTEYHYGATLESRIEKYWLTKLRTILTPDGATTDTATAPAQEPRG